MTRITPLTIDELPVAEREAVADAEALMGFVSNDTLVMARNPLLMHAFAGLIAAVYAPGQIEPGLKRMLGLMTSSASGCRYCVGHTALASRRQGVNGRKLESIWDFEHSAHFDDAERAALRVALHAGQSPGGVTDAMYDRLREHYDDAAQLEIVAVIALFGFLNRWNSTLATDLEALPQAALQALEQT